MARRLRPLRPLDRSLRRKWMSYPRKEEGRGERGGERRGGRDGEMMFDYGNR